jgi:hypothetical protein
METEWLNGARKGLNCLLKESCFAAAVLNYCLCLMQPIICLFCSKTDQYPVAYPGILRAGGVQQIQLETEGKENGDLGAVAP